MSTETLNSFSTPIQHAASADKGFRQFRITDPDAVELPGCKSIETVMLNGHELLQAVAHKVPTDTTQQNFKTVSVPLYKLIEGPGGVPMLLRSLNSNDGKWQVGSTLSVRGEWDDDKAPTAPTAKVATKDVDLESLKQPELRARAAELGIPAFPTAISNAEIITAIRAKLA